MKKLIAVFLTAVMIIGCIPVYSMAGYALDTKVPTIYLRGNGESIYDKDGNKIYDFDFDTSLLPDIAKTIAPSIIKGLATGDFSEYYSQFGQVMRDIYGDCILDENGDATNGSGLCDAQKRFLEERMHRNNKTNKGYYYDYYQYVNDWRLDPLEAADGLANMIDTVLETTGEKKVNIIIKCLGGNIPLAYLAKYGSDKINAIGFGSTVAFGGTYADSIYSGEIKIDPDAVERFVGDKYLQKSLPSDLSIPFQLINETVKFLNVSGVLGFVSDEVIAKVYDIFKEGITPELILSTYGTWAGYWSMISADKYEDARNYVFGEEGSEYYEQYKGLIAKLDEYDRLVRQRIPEILLEAQANGTTIAIVSKYGLQMPPVMKENDETGDVWARSAYSSLGGTFSRLGKTLSPDYIAERTEQGYGKYIAPDRQLDASTCLFKDTTWFIKGAVHDNWLDDENQILVDVCNYEGDNPCHETISNYPQFLVLNEEGNGVLPMTEDNCHNETFEVDAPEKGRFDILLSFFRWLKQILNFLKEKLIPVEIV